MRTLAPLALAIGLIASSALAADWITEDQVAALKVGVSTYDEVVAEFGKPMIVESSSDGGRAITYSKVGTHVKAVSFVPIVGLFAGGAKGKSSTRRFEFDKDGKLTKTASSDSNIECHAFGGCGSK